MQLVQREFKQGECNWVVELSLEPVSIGCSSSGVSPTGKTPFEQAQLEGEDRSRTLEEACVLFEELVRRREADGWVEDERTKSIRCFHNPDRSPTAYWTIRRSYLWSDSVEEEFSPAGHRRQGHAL
ncbi:hypothetical protein SAMN05444166_3384 [Singulisphaera sp. GP187]|uniref:hypothetical protein n=1 Tax=Singulisphaera sp. GP187 TaxID=1882752 RepID=UPI0009268E7B|nr:hypothetical protein [Singulisphaera sp. GP187]SIO27302.1 hypothetical protein SAMN05444166_3384 [Singulisphaera sp. GP187]